jgi:hypothetical protein
MVFWKIDGTRDPLVNVISQFYKYKYHGFLTCGIMRKKNKTTGRKANNMIKVKGEY